MSATVWIVWCPDDGDSGPEDGERISAHGACDAACKWGQMTDGYCTDICEGEEVDVWVCSVDDHNRVKRFRVSGEMVATYYAEELS